MKTLMLIVACFFVACTQPQSTSKTDAGSVVRVLATPTAPTSHHRSMPSVHYVAPPPDPRTPAEIAQAACAGADGKWRCPKLQRKMILAASGSQPIIPASWTVPNWYVDPANGSGCASDSNSGTSSTCGAAGSGIGPLASWGELTVHRWGCLGSPIACPRLQQNTVITFLSNQTCSDVIYFAPATENGAYVAIAGGTPTTVASGVSITVNNTKSRAAGSNSPLNVTYSASAAQGQLVQNTTHSSRAWLYKNVSGNEYTTTQPFTPESIGGSNQPSEVDTWATSDTVNLLQPVQVCLAAFLPVRGEYGAAYTNASYLYQLTVLAPNGTGTDAVLLDTNVFAYEVNFQRLILGHDTPLGTAPTYLTNDAISGGVRWIGGGNAASLAVVGGAIMPSSVVTQGAGGAIAGDAIVGGVISPTLEGTWTFANMYIDQTVTVQHGMAFVQAFGAYTGSVVYGSGTNTIQANHSAVLYHGSAGQAAVNFTAPALISPGFNFEYDSSHVGCLGIPTSASAYATCNIAATVANLDSNLGATVGCIGVPNGGSVCNEL